MRRRRWRRNAGSPARLAEKWKCVHARAYDAVAVRAWDGMYTEVCDEKTLLLYRMTVTAVGLVDLRHARTRDRIKSLPGPEPGVPKGPDTIPTADDWN